MFYVKATLSPDITLFTKVQNNTVYTRCPDCGEELQLELNDLIYNDQIDLDEAACYCMDCFCLRCKEAHR